MKGSISIFLALSLTLIISVILSTTEFSRRIAVSSYLEGVTQIAFDSVFSEYCTQLWEQYHVFATISNNTEFTNNLAEYINNNLIDNSFFRSTLTNISINELSTLNDHYGEIYINQALSYMQYKEISNIADYLFADSDVDYDPSSLVELADGELSTEDFESINFGNLMKMVETANESLLEPDFKLNFSLPESFSLDSLKSITHIFDDTLLFYLVESPYDVSVKSISLENMPSYSIDNIEANSNMSYEFFDKFLFCEYLTEHFSSYATPVTKSALDYQLEYLLNGYDNDEENLLETARQLILLRFGFNITHIISNKDKMNSVTSIANLTSAIPALPIIIEILLICLWALSESVIDVRDLLAGKSVPLFKSADEWSLSIENILDYDYYTESNNSVEGLTYNNYLEILLFNKHMQTLSIRALDLIQLDFSTNINDTFSIVNCIVGASCTFDYTSDDVFGSANPYKRSYISPVHTITQNYYYR